MKDYNKINLRNRARALLLTDIGPTDKIIMVDDASKLPPPPTVVSIDAEVLYVLQRNGNALVVERGVEDTTPAPHKAGSFVEQRLTAGMLSKIIQELNLTQKRVYPGVKKLLIFYAYPRAVNGTWSVDGAASIFSQYDIVVLPENLELPEHHDYSVTRAIISKAKERNPKMLFFGYIRLPMIYHTAIGGSVTEFQRRVESWVKTHGVDGIFIDEFGFDYFIHFGYDRIYGGNYDVFPWARNMQNTALDIVHSFNVPAIVNAWDPQDVWGRDGNMEESHWWIGEDYYLLESVPCFFAEQGGVRNEWAHAGDIWYRTAQCISPTAYGYYKPRLLAVGTINPNVVPQNEFENFYYTRYYMALGLAYALGFEAFGLEKVYYYASDPYLLPTLPDEIQLPDYKHNVVYNYASNVTFTTPSGNRYTGLTRYWLSVPLGTVQAYYQNEREPIYVSFGDYYDYETGKGIIWKKEPYRTLQKLRGELYEIVSSSTRPSDKPNDFEVSIESISYSSVERRATVTIKLTSANERVQGYRVEVSEAGFSRLYTVIGRNANVAHEVYWLPEETGSKTLTIRAQAFTFDNVFSDQKTLNATVNYPSQTQVPAPPAPTLVLDQVLMQTVYFRLTGSQTTTYDYLIQLSKNSNFSQVDLSFTTRNASHSFVVPSNLITSSPMVFYMRAIARNAWGLASQPSNTVSFEVESFSGNLDSIFASLQQLQGSVQQLNSSLNNFAEQITDVIAIQNPYFRDANNNPSLDGWNVVGEGEIIQVTPSTRGIYAFANKSGRFAQLLTKLIPIDKNETYVLEAYFKYQIKGNAKPSFVVYLYDSNKQLIGTGPWLDQLPAGFEPPTTEFGFTYILLGSGTSLQFPASAAFASVGVKLNYSGSAPGTSVIAVQGLYLRKVLDGIYVKNLDGQTIKAGTVTAAQIAAGSITAEKIAAGSVTADKLAANSVTAEKIRAGAITADKLAAGAVTANAISSKAVTAEHLDVQDLSAIRAKASALVVNATPAEVTPEVGKLVVSDSNANSTIAPGSIKIQSGTDYIILTPNGLVSTKPIITDPGQIAPGVLTSNQTSYKVVNYTGGQNPFSITELHVNFDQRYWKVLCDYLVQVPRSSCPGGYATIIQTRSYTLDSALFSTVFLQETGAVSFEVTTNITVNQISSLVPQSITLPPGTYDAWCGTTMTKVTTTSTLTAQLSQIYPDSPTLYFEATLTGFVPSQTYRLTPSAWKNGNLDNVGLNAIYVWLNNKWQQFNSALTLSGINQLKILYQRSLWSSSEFGTYKFSIRMEKPSSPRTVATVPILGGMLVDGPNILENTTCDNIVPTPESTKAWSVGYVPTLTYFRQQTDRIYGCWYDFYSTFGRTVDVKVIVYLAPGNLYVWYMDANGVWRKHDGTALGNSLPGAPTAQGIYQTVTYAFPNIRGLILISTFRTNVPETGLISAVEYTL